VWSYGAMNETFETLFSRQSGPKDPATSAETRELFTKLSARGYVKLRHVLVQLPDENEERKSTVGRMLNDRKHRALLLYLLILTCWPWLSGNKKPLAAAVWLRALTGTPTAKNALTWSNSTLSRALGDLEGLGLIEKRDRVKRLSRIAPRREDGQDVYTAPEGRRDRYNTYFTLPDSFWNSETFAQLTFSGLVMLLIIAKETSQKPEMYIPHEKAKEWYGISAGTVKYGIKNLRELELLDERPEWRKAPLSATGLTKRKWYSLKGDYSQESRKQMQDTSKAERSDRLKSRAARLASEQSPSDESD
jgi:hypothetical protein